MHGPSSWRSLAAGALLSVSPRLPAWLGWLAAPLRAAGLVATPFSCGMSLPVAPVMQQAGLGCTLLTGAFTLAVIATSLALGFVSYHAFERWFLALKRCFPSGG